MLTPQEFYEWERSSRDTIDVKRCYIDIAGDLVGGILLSQIIYWFLPGQKGVKLRVEKEDRLWLAKGRTAWWEECRISPKQFDRAIKLLQSKGLVDVKRFRFSGSPTIHIWLNIETLVDSVNSSLTKGEVPSLPSGRRTSPKGKLDNDQEVNSLTETNAKTNAETPSESIEGEPSPPKNQVNEVYKVMQLYYGYPEKTDIDPIPSYGKEGTAIKRMLKRGFGIDQIVSCWIQKVQAAGKFKSMVYVNEDIGVAPGDNSKNAGVNKIGTDDPDKFIKGKYGHMVRR